MQQTCVHSLKEHQVNPLFRSLDIRKAAWTDGIPGKVLETSGDHFSAVLTKIFNLCLTHAMVHCIDTTGCKYFLKACVKPHQIRPPVCLPSGCIQWVQINWWCHLHSPPHISTPRMTRDLHKDALHKIQFGFHHPWHPCGQCPTRLLSESAPVWSGWFGVVIYCVALALS